MRRFSARPLALRRDGKYSKDRLRKLVVLRLARTRVSMSCSVDAGPFSAHRARRTARLLLHLTLAVGALGLARAAHAQRPVYNSGIVAGADWLQANALP